MFETGTKLVRRFDPELGVGVVTAVDGRFLDVFFPDAMERMRLTADPETIEIVELTPGHAVRTPDGDVRLLASVEGLVGVLDDGSEHLLSDLWPMFEVPGPIDRLLNGELDDESHLRNRIDGLRLSMLREEGDLASLLGGRVELFAHQLHTALRAIRGHGEVRWLLADEVGLGKTIVACMVASTLIRMGRAERVVIAAPDTLTVQWLGELYRKFHQIFVHIDDERLDCVRTDFGVEVNPFDVHPLSVISLELLAAQPSLLVAIAASNPHVIVLDEAHRAAQPELASLLPLLETTPHAIALTGTPFHGGEPGFELLCDSLGLPREARNVGQVSAVSRQDLPNLPRRQPEPIQVDGSTDALEERDPRVEWLVAQIPKWQARNERTLVFVNSAEHAQRLAKHLEFLSRISVFVFHEEMRTKQRDIELARFRVSRSPVMISSGAGSEGRNFQFFDRLVHMELPPDALTLEQRIGRLDRIGRVDDIPVVYFLDDAGDGLAERYEAMGVFANATAAASEFRERWNFPHSFRAEDVDAVMDHIPDGLEALVERFCIDAAERIGMNVVDKDGDRTWFFEVGSTMMVDTVPGLDDDSRFLGTFARADAVADLDLDFFANGHPLVEGLLAELDDSRNGRVGAYLLDVGALEDVEPPPEGLYLLTSSGPERALSLAPLGKSSESPAASPNRAAQAAAVLGALGSGAPIAKKVLKRLLAQLDAEHVRQQAQDADVVVLVGLLAS